MNKKNHRFEYNMKIVCWYVIDKLFTFGGIVQNMDAIVPAGC